MTNLPLHYPKKRIKTSAIMIFIRNFVTNLEVIYDNN